jgi:predicted GIY-YIG superfamily endonuclease
MVYLIHLDAPLHHAQHYLGFVADDSMVLERLAKHQAGTGSKFLRAVNAAGIRYYIARVWPGAGRTEERKLKNKKKSRTLCPICNKKH